MSQCTKETLHTRLPSFLTSASFSHLFKAFIHSTYFTYLRNNYPIIQSFSQQHIQSLIKNAQYYRIFQYQNDLQFINDSSKTMIVIYGAVCCRNKLYVKDDFFVCEKGTTELSFKQKTALLIISQKQVENKLNQLAIFYTKRELIYKIFPIDLLQLSKQQIETLISNLQSKQEQNQNFIRVENQNILHTNGIYLCFGDRFIIKTKEGLSFSEIYADYFGEESVWSNKFDFELCSSENSQYYFLQSKVILNTLTSNQIQILKQLYQKKYQLREELIVRYKANLCLLKNVKTLHQNCKVKTLNPQTRVNSFDHFSSLRCKAQNRRPKIIRQRYTNCSSLSISMNIRKNTPELYKSTEKSQNRTTENTKQASNKDNKKNSYSSSQEFKSRFFREQSVKSEKYFKKRHLTEPKKLTSYPTGYKKLKIKSDTKEKFNKTISNFLKFIEKSTRGIPYVEVDEWTTTSTTKNFIPFKFREKLTQIKIQNKHLLQQMKETPQQTSTVPFKMDFTED